MSPVQGCLQFLIPSRGGGVSKSAGEEYQVEKRRRENHCCLEELKHEKKSQRGSNIIFPLILRLLGRKSSGEEGKGTENLGNKIKIKKNGAGKNINV